jgi:hypothetical protein
MVPFVHSPCGFKVVYHGYPVAASEVPVSTPLAQSARVYFGGFAPDFPHYISGKEFKKMKTFIVYDLDSQMPVAVGEQVSAEVRKDEG